MTAPTESLKDLASRWWAYRVMWSAGREDWLQLEASDDPDVVAVREASSDVFMLMNAGGPVALELARVLVHAAPDEDDLGAVCIGPLQELLFHHGDDLAPQIDALAGRDEQFAAALAWVSVPDGRLGGTAHRILLRWMPHLEHVAIRRPRRKGPRWKDQ